MVMACIALLVALGPAVLAANTIGSSDIIDESILSQDIKNGEVQTVDLADLAVTQAKLGPSAVGTGNVADNSLTGADLADFAVTRTKLGLNSIGSNNVVNEALTGADLKGANGNSAISLAAGAVANGRCKDFPVVVAGASLGEAVVVSLKRSVPPGMLFYGVMVPAANRVTVKVCNLTGGASPAISALPLRVFTFG